MIRVILFDDRKSFRSSLEQFLAGSATIFVAASFAHANDAVKHVRTYNPDVIVMDIQMPGASGLEALQAIQAARPGAKVLMLTSFDNDDMIFSALCNKASGYALKSDTPDKIQQAIEEVHNGCRYLTPSLAGKVYALMQNHIVQAQPTYVPLTDKQKSVLFWMVQGKSRKMIADEMAIHIDTVGDHIKEIYRKLHVNSAPEAVREALQRKII